MSRTPTGMQGLTTVFASRVAVDRAAKGGAKGLALTGAVAAGLINIMGDLRQGRRLAEEAVAAVRSAPDFAGLGVATDDEIADIILKRLEAVQAQRRGR